ncbi:MAG TPA: hypothetical protein VIJ63_16070 [Roseiarcus sp.]
MRTTTRKIDYAVQRQSPNFDDWDTIRSSITPHEARARRLMRWQQGLRTRFQFRVVKLETQTTIIPIEEK